MRLPPVYFCAQGRYNGAVNPTMRNFSSATERGVVQERFAEIFSGHLTIYL